jgi:hypothetical protein
MCTKGHSAWNETMTEIRLWTGLIRHSLLLWRTGQLRFRLETFGAYYPAAPYETPVWRVTPTHFFLLVRRARAYARWLVEMEELRRWGAAGWWEQHGVTWRDCPHD